MSKVSSWRGRDLRGGHRSIHDDHPDFTGSDLRDQLISRHVPWEVTDPRRATITIPSGRATFSRADLRGTNMTSDWSQTSFVRANGAQSTWMTAVIQDCNFTAARLVESLWRGIHFKNCIFDEADLSRSKFENVVFDTCALRGSRLRRVENPRQDTQDFTGLIFTDSYLAGSDFSGATSYNFTFTKCVAPSCDFSRVQFMRSDFRGSDLRRATFDGAKLPGSKFRSAVLRGSSFVKADLTGAEFDGADLTDADLTGATLRDWDMVGTILDGVRGVDAQRLANIKSLSS